MDAEAARQDMAKAAQQLLQDPMRHLTQLEKLLGLARATDSQVLGSWGTSLSDSNPCVALYEPRLHCTNPSQVRCLAMLTLRAVFKDLLPAYRIHSKTREELPHKVCHVFHNLGLKAVALLRKRGSAGNQGRGTAAAL